MADEILADCSQNRKSAKINSLVNMWCSLGRQPVYMTHEHRDTTIICTQTQGLVEGPVVVQNVCVQIQNTVTC